MTNYIPRINTTINDLGLKIAPPPAGPKVTLLGVTSNTGVTALEPYTISSVEKALNTFYFSGIPGINNGGVFPGELSLAIEEAVNAGAQNIEVVVIGHYSGEALAHYINPTADPTGRYIDLFYGYNVLRNRDLDVIVPVGCYMDNDVTGVSPSSFGKQLANFCFQATQENNSCVGVISTMPVIPWALKRMYALASHTTLSGELNSLIGTNLSGWKVSGSTTITLTGTVLNTALKSARFATPSSLLFNEYVSYHTRPGQSALFASDVYQADNYGPYYLGWLSGAADQNGDTLEDVSASTANAVSTAYFAKWQAADSDSNPHVDSRGIKSDAGAYLSVFTAPVVSLGTQTKTLALALGSSPASISYTSDGAPAYAGLINTLAPQSSTTNKQIDGISSNRRLSASQANDLVGMRHVTLYSRTKGLTIASGVTGAYNVTQYIRSDFTRLTTVRIVHAVVDLVRSVADKYIGEANNAAAMNSLDAEIGQALISLKGQGALNSYDYSISSTPDQRVLGQLDINLSLVPAFEIQTINLVVSLDKGV